MDPRRHGDAGFLVAFLMLAAAVQVTLRILVGRPHRYQHGPSGLELQEW